MKIVYILSMSSIFPFGLFERQFFQEDDKKEDNKGEDDKGDDGEYCKMTTRRRTNGSKTHKMTSRRKLRKMTKGSKTTERNTTTGKQGERGL